MSPVLCRVLLYCVLSAMVLFLIGLALLLSGNGSDEIDEKMSLDQIIDSMAKISAEGVIGLGVIVVVVTPLIRILTTTMLAVRNRYTAIAILTMLSLASIISAFIIKTLA